MANKDKATLMQEEIFLYMLDKHSHPFVAQWARLQLNQGHSCNEVRNALARLVQKAPKFMEEII